MNHYSDIHEQEGRTSCNSQASPIPMNLLYNPCQHMHNTTTPSTPSTLSNGWAISIATCGTTLLALKALLCIGFDSSYKETTCREIIQNFSPPSWQVGGEF